MTEKKTIIVPDEQLPHIEEGENICECMKKPVDLRKKKGYLSWSAETGSTVKKGDTVCDIEVDKKTVVITSGYDGVLTEKCFEDGEVVKAGDILGYVCT